MWHLMHSNPCGALLPSSIVLKATWAFFICLAIASNLWVDLVMWSIDKESSTDLGRRDGQFCVSFSSTWHSLASSGIWLHPVSWWCRKPTRWAGFESDFHLNCKLSILGWVRWRSDSFLQVVEPPVHLQQMNQHLVDLHWQVLPSTVICCWSSKSQLSVHLTWTRLCNRT